MMSQDERSKVATQLAAAILSEIEFEDTDEAAEIATDLYFKLMDSLQRGDTGRQMAPSQVAPAKEPRRSWTSEAAEDTVAS